MDEYTIYCTKEQTKKALELGAPIKIECFSTATEDHWQEVIPTAEQMIGWLEDQEGIEEITVSKTVMWIWGENHTLINGSPNYSSRQESTLAAIDAALNYLKRNQRNINYQKL